MKKRKLRLKKKNFFLLLSIICSIILISCNIFYLIPWLLDNQKEKQEMKKIKEKTPIIEIEEKEKKEEDATTSFDPYWDFTKMNYIEVDFSNLLKMNAETVAWISVNNTNINYPIVQHSDNKYYLTHSFDHSQNSAGWVFMDYRNDAKNFQKNTIIYAHGRKNGSMFGTLKNVLNKKWYQNTNNHSIRISSPQENSIWQVFSIYKIATTNDYIQTKFSSDTSFSNFLDKIIKRSIYNFETEITTTDKILTLSTCFNEKEKIVLHAKLIKSQKR